MMIFLVWPDRFRQVRCAYTKDRPPRYPETHKEDFRETRDYRKQSGGRQSRSTILGLSIIAKVMWISF